MQVGCKWKGLLLSEYALPPKDFKQESNVILTIEKALFSKFKAWFEEGKTGDWQGMAVLGEGEGESERTQPGQRFEELV